MGRECGVSGVGERDKRRERGRGVKEGETNEDRGGRKEGERERDERGRNERR